MNRYIKGRITKGEFVSELFKQRVESISGTYEANDCLINSLNSLTDREFKDAKLILTPNGYVVDKLPTIKPNGGGDATVTRNTTKTRVNSSGLIESNAVNVLAPDYLNGVCPALNVEGQATNTLNYTSEFDNAYWSKGNLSVSPNVAISPNGSQDADKIIPNTTDSIHSISRVLQSITGGIYSVFAKADGYDYILLTSHNSSNPAGRGQFFNVRTGEQVSGGSANQSFKIEKYANGWFRISINEGDMPSSIWTVIPTNSPAAISFAGDGTKGVLIWGGQNEQGTEVTSYIPTTAQVTRSADSVTVPIPAGVTEIIEKYEDGTTNTITTIPASHYTVPTGKRYEYILMR